MIERKLFLFFIFMMPFILLFGQTKSKFVKTTITCEMKNEWLKNRKLPIPEQFPLPTNILDIETEFKINPSIFDNYPNDQVLSYSYFVTVNKKGKVTDIEFLVLANGFIEDDLINSIKNIKFKPAMLKKKPVSSYIVVEYKLICNGCK